MNDCREQTPWRPAVMGQVAVSALLTWRSSEKAGLGTKATPASLM